MTNNKGLSTVEAELYDRQIRLWGIESQEKLRAANVLLIGVKGLGSEIAKNILLSGINCLTILDDSIVTLKELHRNYLLSSGSIGKKIADAVVEKARTLNPLVKLVADCEPLATKTENYFSKFTIIAASGLNTDQILSIDSACRKFNVQFIYGDVFGMFGFVMLDLLDHQYVVNEVRYRTKRFRVGKPKRENSIVHKAEDKTIYPSFDEVLLKTEEKIKEAGGETKKRRNPLYYLLRVLIQFRDRNGRDPSIETEDKDLEKLMNIREEVLNLYKISEDKLKEDSFPLVFGEVGPTCAIIGGVLGQEIIRAVSHKEVPIINMFLLDPHTFQGKTEHVCATNYIITV